VSADIATSRERAVIEMAQASGLHRLAGPPQPMSATTYGVGELIRFALDLGYRRLVLTVGGSATTDAGAGMLQALGARLITSDGSTVAPGGVGLANVARIELDGLDARLADVEVILASDVDSPLLGPQGAAAVFAPQKGASPAEVVLLERGLANFVQSLVPVVDREHQRDPGAGAAGGTGFAAMAAFGARRVPGIDFVLAELGIADLMSAAALVVVGEGHLDEQSLAGKAPIGVAALARTRGIPVAAVGGQISVAAATLARHGIDHHFAVLDRAGSLDSAIRDVTTHLAAIGASIAALVPRDAGPRCPAPIPAPNQ
jgi:glycerate kinase